MSVDAVSSMNSLVGMRWKMCNFYDGRFLFYEKKFAFVIWLALIRQYLVFSFYHPTGLERIEGWVSLGGWLDLEMVYPAVDGHWSPIQVLTGPDFFNFQFNFIVKLAWQNAANGQNIKWTTKCTNSAQQTVMRKHSPSMYMHIQHSKKER